MSNAARLTLLGLLFTLYLPALAVDAPAFKAATTVGTPTSTPGTAIVKVVGSKTTPILSGGVDSGKDQIQRLRLSGYNSGWDLVTADHTTKKVIIQDQPSSGLTNYSPITFNFSSAAGEMTDVAVDNLAHHSGDVDDVVVVVSGTLHVITNSRAAGAAAAPTPSGSLVLSAQDADSNPITLTRVAIADFNQDGKLDLAAVGTSVVGGVNRVQVAVFLSTATQDGVASFAPAAVYTTALVRATGDFIAVGNFTSNNVDANSQPVIDPYPEIVIGGNNGDDAGTGTTNAAGYGVLVVFYNNGDGTFATDADPNNYPYYQQVNRHLNALAVADVTGDGHRDVVTEESSLDLHQTFLEVYGGNVHGYIGSDFQGSRALGTYATPTFQAALALADFNGDGTVDIASTFPPDGVDITSIPAHPDQGPNFPGPNGVFGGFIVGPNAKAMDVTDADNNGNYDLAVAAESPKEFSVLVNGKGGTTGGGGTLTPPTAPTFSVSPARADQVVDVRCDFATTIAGAKVTFEYRPAGTSGNGGWKTAGTDKRADNQGSWGVQVPALLVGSYEFRATASAPHADPATSDTSTLQITFARPTLAGLPKVKVTPNGLLISAILLEPGFEKNLKIADPDHGKTAPIVARVESSLDGTNFTAQHDVKIAGANGKITVSGTLPLNAPYFRLAITIGANTIYSPTFSLFTIDATIALVTNDDTAADDATATVKTGAALGKNKITTDAKGETKAALIPNGGFQTFAVTLLNQTPYAENITVSGTASDSQFEVLYFDGASTAQTPLIGADITSAITLQSAAYTHMLPASSSSTLYVRVRTLPGTDPKLVKNIGIYASVVDHPEHEDAVALAVKSTAASKVIFVTDGGSSGPGTFAAAIAAANLKPGSTIEFEVPDGAYWNHTDDHRPLLEIDCSAELPAITAAGTVIDATSQRELPDQDYAASVPAVRLIGHSTPIDATNPGPVPNETGLKITAANCQVKGLSFTHFAAGLRITGSTAKNTKVTACEFIANQNYGLRIDAGSSGTLVGGATAEDRNYFRAGHWASNSDANGVDSLFGLSISGSSRNKVQGNFVGTAVDGSADPLSAHGFVGAGIILEQEASGNLIGGDTHGSGNLISGNSFPGVDQRIGLEILTSNNTVQGNLIGTNLAGTSANGNFYGILIAADDANPNRILPADSNLIGSTLADSGANVISGNDTGLFIDANSSHNAVIGNLIGTTADGDAALPNDLGVGVAGTDNTIGGKNMSYRNVISGNTAGGVVLGTGSNAAIGGSNFVLSNFIGIDSQNKTQLGNGGNGVTVFSGGNTIGDTGTGNVISFNHKGGVVVIGPSSAQNSVRANSMVGNTDLGIDLRATNTVQATLVTPNDDESDGLQNYPVITGATAGKKNVYALAGTFDSVPNQLFTLDIYLNDAADPSGHGEGRIYLGAATATTNAAGHVAFNYNVAIPTAGQPATGKYVTMTATAKVKDGKGFFYNGTSEFAADFQLP